MFRIFSCSAVHSVLRFSNAAVLIFQNRILKKIRDVDFYNCAPKLLNNILKKH